MKIHLRLAQMIMVVLLFASGGSVVSKWQHAAVNAAGAATDKQAGAATRTLLKQNYGRLPLRFEAYAALPGEQTRFAARGSGYAMLLAPDEFVLRLRAPAASDKLESNNNPDHRAATLRLRLVGARPQPSVTGLEKLPTKSNYFVGHDPRRWRTSIANFARVKYTSVYPGIDLVWYGNQQQLEHDFIIAPGADPRRIKLAFSGAEKITIDQQGALQIAVAGGVLSLLKPQAWQEIDGVRRAVACDYRLGARGRISFRLGAYDRRQPLVIDPVLAYSTYLGGAASEQALGIAVDGAGNAYLTGLTTSTDFPGASQIQTAIGGQTDAFVVKLNPAGDGVVYATWLGGNGGDAADEIAVDAAGNAVVAGSTSSTNFPLKNALQADRRGTGDAFITKLNADGSELIFSTLLGGAGSEGISGLALDAAGNSYLLGATDATDFPLLNAFQNTRGGSGAYASSNAGEQWQAIGNGLDGTDVNDFAFDPTNAQTVYAATNRGVFKSIDSGATWAQLGGNQFTVGVAQILVDPGQATTLYATTPSQLFKSTDGGATWTLKNLFPLYRLAVDVTTPLLVYAATPNGFRVSTDGGETFRPGVLRPIGGGSVVRVDTVAADPVTPLTVYAGTQLGVYKSTDGGANWTYISLGLFTLGQSYLFNQLLISPANPQIIYGLLRSGTIYKSVNGGRDWTLLRLPAPPGQTSGFIEPRRLAADPLDENTVYAGTRGFGVYRSTDGGATWTSRNNGLNNGDVPALVIDRRAPQRIYAGTDSGADAFVVKLNATGAALVYSSYLGGNDTEFTRGLAVDAAGNAYVTGYTASPDFPVVNALRPTRGGRFDAFVAKVNATGSGLTWSSYLGGAGDDFSHGIAVNVEGNAFVAGQTSSRDFPLVNAAQTTYSDKQFNAADAFVVRFAADGSKLDYATYLGGEHYDSAAAITIDQASQAHVTGSTLSLDFPLVGAVQSKRGGVPEAAGNDAFITKLSADGKSFIYSTFLGGAFDDQGTAIAVDATGNAYVTGWTGSSDFPVTPRTLPAGALSNAFVAKLTLSADLALTMTDLPDPFYQPSGTTYTLSIVNNGPDAAEDVTVTDTLSGLTPFFITVSQGSCAGNAPIICKLGTLAAQAQATINITARPAGAGPFSNQAQATSLTPDANPANNSATEETTAKQTVSIYGYVRLANGAGLGGVTLTSSNAQTPPVVTRADGAYQFADLAFGGTQMYTLTPALPGYVFNPPSQMRSYLNGDNRADFAAVACAFTLAPANQTFAPAGGAGTVTITAADPQCAWTARSNATWIRITSASSGNGSGAVSFTVDPSVTARQGTLLIAGRTFTVWQEHYSCPGVPSFTVPQLFPLIDRPGRFLTGDFNGDGLTDVVLRNSSGQIYRLALALGNNAGGFNAPLPAVSGASLPSLTPAFGAGDFNNDGKLDLVLGGGGAESRVWVFLGDGAGGFTMAGMTATPNFIARLRVGDVNNDGRADVVTLSQTGQRIAVLLGTGAGALGAPMAVTLPGSPSGTDTPDDILLTDTNNDGKLDLAYTALSVLRVLPGDGAGAFGAAIQIPLGSDRPSVNGLALADLNGDGRKDAVVATGSGLYVLRGNANSFEAPTVYRIGIVVGVPSIADFTGDGLLDVATLSEEGLLLLPGARNDGFGAPLFYYDGLSHRGPTIGEFSDTAAGDFNRDGRTDLLTLGQLYPTSTAPVALALILGDARGGFAAPSITPVDLVPNYAITEDLNADGNADLIVAVANNEVAIFIGNGQDGFNAPVRYTVGADPQFLAARDFNRDGRPDIIVLNRGSASVTILINNGRGEFPTAFQVVVGTNPQALGLGDFNSDGRLDFIVQSTAGPLALLVGDGNGSFTTLTANVAPQLNGIVFTVGDFTGDGLLDLAVPASASISCSSATSEVVILAGDGRGGFAVASRITTPDGVATLAAGDLNGDGRADLIIRATCGARQNDVLIALSNAAGAFAAPVGYTVETGVRALVPGDLNNDGRLDLVVTHTPGFVSLLLNNGDGTLAAPVLLSTGSLPAAIVLGDVTGDGLADLTVLRNQDFAGSLMVLRGASRCVGAGGLALTSAASYSSGALAAEAIAAAFGVELSTTTQAATTLPLPTTLGGVSVQIKDSLGVTRSAPLFFVSPNQINYLIPPGTAPGVALVTVTNVANTTATGTVLIAPVAPALFAADASGRGLAAATVLRVKADGTQVFEPVAQFNQAQNRFNPVPIDVSDANEQVFLLLFGTGLRGRSSLAAVTAAINDASVEVLYAGAQGGFAGLDQINLRLAPTLAGQGLAEIRLAVDGRATNTVNVSIR